MMFHVLVTGARGKTGREVIKQLRNRPNTVVRAGSSQPNGQPSATVQPVRFDWRDRATWRNAAEGVDAIYLMRPDLPAAPELVAGLVGLAPRAHVVLLSEQGADVLTSDHWVRRVEDAVMTLAAAWTLLRPSWFQQVLTDPRFFGDAIRTQRVIRMPSGGARIAWVVNDRQHRRPTSDAAARRTGYVEEMRVTWREAAMNTGCELRFVLLYPPASSEHRRRLRDRSRGLQHVES